jgi:hypothetical protein
MEMMVVKSVVTVEIGADLLMSVLEKEENENGGVDGLLPLWRKKEKQSVERMVVKPAVTVVVAEGTTEKEKEERVTIEKREKEGRVAGFYRLWTRFSSCSSHEIQIYL